MPDTSTETPTLDRPAYSSEPIHKYSLLAPKLWHGMRFSDWWRLLRENRFKVSGHGVGAAVAITVASAFNSLAAADSRWRRSKRVAHVKLNEPPLFVLGHWRSGTTMLHEMLIRDPEHGYPTTYQCMVPHHFLLSQWWVPPISGWVLPKKRPMDNVATGWARPQEDEFAMMNMGLPSPYRSWAFPHHGPVDGDALTLETFTDKQRSEWKKTLRRFVRSVALNDNRRLIFKSPPHTARVRTLLEAFPDARFVHIARDPLTLFPSTLRLWKSMCDTQGLQRAEPHYDWIEQEVLDNFAAMYEAYERDQKLIPPGQLAELKYEDLVADPKGQLKQVYETLSLGEFERIEPALDGYLKEQKDYKTNRYQLPAEVEQRVRDRWASYFERYDYA